MFGLDIAAQASGIVLAGLTACSGPLEPAVSVTFAYTPPVYSQAMTMEQLTAEAKQKGSIYGMTELGHVGGMTRNDFSMNYGVQMGGMADSKTGDYCIWVDEIKVTLSYAPVIAIASDFVQGSCWYFRTMAHELKHVDATLKTAQEYKPYFQKLAHGLARKVEPLYPVPAKDIKEAQQYLADRFKEPMARAGTKMMEAESIRQHAVDDFELNKVMTTDCAKAPVR